MRRQFGQVLLAGVVGVLAAPICIYAEGINDRINDSEASVSSAAVAAPRYFPAAGLRDEATMVLIGTALLGLAAAVRRAA